MAKKVVGFETDDNGRVRHFSHKLTKAQRKSESQLIPWSEGPTTRWQKFKRGAVG